MSLIWRFAARLGPPGRFQTLEIPGPIRILTAPVRSTADVRARLAELKAMELDRLTVLIHVPTGATAAGLADALAAAPLCEAVVLAPAPWGHSSRARVPPRALQDGRPRDDHNRLVFESDPEQALLGAVQWLLPGETLAVLWQARGWPGRPAALVAHGIRWRESGAARD